ncbi:MAG: hypothetical protein K9G44_10670 [Melioribacteraceae bacterium]|nr:hypothetical protein [Melioribacteraceae bacterium]
MYKITDDDNSNYTDAGNLRLTVTNFGTYGHGFTLWPQQPSCEFPAGSGIEHIYDGGLWVGALSKSNDEFGNGKQVGPFVSTGAVDASSVSNRGGGFEFTNKIGSFVKEQSSLVDNTFFRPEAVSHQDFVMEYSDTARTLPGSNEVIVDHRPLGIVVKHEVYNWNFPFANFFVIMNYTIKNVSNQYLDSVYVGLWTDTVVRNTNVTSPRGSAFYSRGGNGYEDSLKMAYEFDVDGDPGFTDSYVGIQYLGSSVPSDSVSFVSWQFRNTSSPFFFMPSTDQERYRKMQGYLAGNSKWYDINLSQLKQPSNRSMMISAGPYAQIAPGDSLNIAFAIVGAKKFGTDPAGDDTKLQKKNLYDNAGWALRTYYGEDKNGNNILDEGEDLDDDGKITRYILPSPPQIPKVRVVPENKKVTIYWDKRSESSIDPISGIKDFEGYRIYRTNAGFDLTESQDLLNSLVLVAEYDSIGNNISYNTGFESIELSEPVTFPGDSTKYYYKFEIDNQLNGWQYVYTVTSFDRGDQQNNIESLESSRLTASARVLPGTPATSDAGIEVGVYPNPYYGSAYWDGSSERLRKIYFYNLPAECELRIYTLSGDVVKTIYHNQESNGSDLRWFETFSREGNQQMSGGEHAWDLISDNDQAIATGLYLYTVKDYSSDNVKIGKFLVIK